jgi:hypothetical protein
MIRDPDLSRKIAILVETDDEILGAFPPLERCIIIALKCMAENEKKVACVEADEL